MSTTTKQTWPSSVEDCTPTSEIARLARVVARHRTTLADHDRVLSQYRARLDDCNRVIRNAHPDMDFTVLAAAEAGTRLLAVWISRVGEDTLAASTNQHLAESDLEAAWQRYHDARRALTGEGWVVTDAERQRHRRTVTELTGFTPPA